MSRRTENDPAFEREPTPMEQAALEWIVRCERGLDEEATRELERWLQAEPRHRELFAEFGGTWAVMGRAAEQHERAPAGRTTGQVLDFPVAPPAAARRRLSRIWLPLAAAAAIAIGGTAWWGAAHDGTAIATAVGDMRRLELSDGSTVELNTNSAIVTTFTRAERRVRLEKGEAYFEVAKDEQRPFLVEAAGVGVRAIGTAFNVRLRSESVEVLVTEGKVRVGAERARAADGTQQPSPGPSSSTDAIVGAGERVVVTVAPRAGSEPGRLDVVPVQAVEVQRLLAWHGRRLEFSDTPLAEMAAEFNRYNRHQLVIVDENLAAMRFGGSFRPDDRAGFVRMLQEHFGVRAEERKNQTILRGAR